VCALVTLFWATFDQQGNTLLLWAEDFTDRSIDLGFWRGEIPSPWFLALNPLMIFVLTPLIVRLWARQAARGVEPYTISKMAFGCLCVALANLIMAAAAAVAAGGKASPAWLVGYFALVTLGELHLAPVGLALMSKSAPIRLRSMMMGVWFATTFPADVLAGYLGGFWSSMAKPNFFLMIAMIAALAAAAIGASTRTLRSMLEGPVSASTDRSA
jgi:POT family proton-dependent oligopeptide transporter